MNHRNYGDSLVNLVGLQKQLLPKNPATSALVGCQSWEVQLDGIVKTLLTKEEKEQLNEYHLEVYEKLSPYLNEKEKEFLKEYTKSI